MTAAPGEPNAEMGRVHIIDKYRMTVTVPVGKGMAQADSTAPWITYLGLPRKELPQLALEYVEVLSNATTEQLCTCTWIETEIHGKMTPKREEEDLLCPQHSRVGFLLGFFEWAFRNTDDTLSKWRVMAGDVDDESPAEAPSN